MASISHRGRGSKVVVGGCSRSMGERCRVRITGNRINHCIVLPKSPGEYMGVTRCFSGPILVTSGERCVACAKALSKIGIDMASANVNNPSTSVTVRRLCHYKTSAFIEVKAYNKVRARVGDKSVMVTATTMHVRKADERCTPVRCPTITGLSIAGTLIRTTGRGKFVCRANIMRSGSSFCKRRRPRTVPTNCRLVGG